MSKEIKTGVSYLKVWKAVNFLRSLGLCKVLIGPYPGDVSVKAVILWRTHYFVFTMPVE